MNAVALFGASAPCVCCGDTDTAHLTVDHQVPRCLGGGSGSNLVARCWRCNHVKSALEAWLVKQVRRGQLTLRQAQRQLRSEAAAYCQRQAHGRNKPCRCASCMAAVLL